MDENKQAMFHKMRELFANSLSLLPPYLVKKKPGFDELSFNIGPLIQGSAREPISGFVGIAETCGLEDFSISKTPEGVQFVVRGYESLNMLADLGVNFPGSSNYKTSSISK